MYNINDSFEKRLNDSFDESKHKALTKMTSKFADPVISPQKIKKNKNKSPLHKILGLEETLKTYR